MNASERIGNISIDGGAIAVVDATYLMTDEDHDAGRDEAEVVSGYDAAYVPISADGVFPVFVDRDATGRVVTIRIELGG
jgi:hypothetical protein